MVRPWASSDKAKGSADPEPPGKANGRGRDGEPPSNIMRHNN